VNITHHIKHAQRLIEIQFSGYDNEESAHKIIQRAMVKVHGSDVQEVLLDLRNVTFKNPSSMLRLHSVIKVFKSILMQKELLVTIMFNTEDGARWLFLEKATEFEGINVRCFTNRKAALLGARLFAIQTKPTRCKLKDALQASPYIT